MIGLSTIDNVDHIKNTFYSYKRGYYIMIWKYYVSYFSKDHEEVQANSAHEPKPDSLISVQYDKKTKVCSFFNAHFRFVLMVRLSTFTWMANCWRITHSRMSSGKRIIIWLPFFVWRKIVLLC
jgi:hypothetical protein